MNSCEYCGKPCAVRFCTRSCNISFQNSKRDNSFSQEFKRAECIMCNTELFIKKQQSSIRAKCQQCKIVQYEAIKRARTPLLNNLTCQDCQCQFIAGTAKFCLTCRKIRQENSGRKSASIQASSRRSWSEIELGKLCQVNFQHVSFNDPIFPNDPPTETHWDADILIHDFCVAVLWNGPWHYRKLRPQHSLDQVQRRDQIKLNQIIAFGWQPIIIRDDIGKKDIVKVHSAFDEITSLCATLMSI